MFHEIELFSILIPCRNESKFISECLKSLIAQTYPKNRIEIIVLDGMSSDDTRQVVREYVNKYAFIYFIQNTKEYKPYALNIGIREAKGSIIMIADAHAAYENDYVTKCVTHLNNYSADVVGGILKTEPRVYTLQARAIAMILSHSLGAGGATFRTGSNSPREVDTVFGGCYKKEIFERVGLFNEHLVRSQDIEMNTRIRRHGGKIILDPSIVCTYYPKSTLHAFFTHNILDGIWAIYPLKFVRVPLRLRHYIPLFFILCLLVLGTGVLISLTLLPLFVIILFIYSTITLVASTLIAIREKSLRLIPFLFLSFLARHFAYGIGSLIGGVKLFLPVNSTYGTTKTKRN